MSKYRTWLLGISTSILIACGVESPPANPPPAPETSTAQSALSDDPAMASPQFPVGSACTTGDSAVCCPFPRGCSCPGEQECVNSRWGLCEGASEVGHFCD